MIDYKALESALYSAFLEAARALGGDLKQISWFGRNKKSRESVESLQIREAA